ncbi:SPT5-like transcription initiation protein [Ordospora colligata]|uniref:Chromatin elongation factor SPT5 n=1 Tax=Ordospora colligata OC4 TaxID=1354746 RepID=A0A0B2UHY7_9MICR|nr:SPT5-like transcription initiation protein [Ordospora colligata OC4]KHN68958.1 SPT5-like transcription initiation protein [Ordospora colligata OC4]TBU14181.1 SPT5-like transcription initiation protein [Ordospora colligata]TBU17850.1 SPT5-like transcription initiation protein [Ordospora colligata]
MAKRPLSKYVSVEASEDDSEQSSENIDDIQDVAIPTRNWKNIAKELEEKYADVPDEEDSEEEETVEHGIRQTSLVPRSTSPRMFIVRVKRGSEKEVMMKIVENDPKNVFGIVYKEGLKGYIYIEAFQKQHVIDALGSIRGVSRTKISVVPQKEMIEAVTYCEPEAYGEWGRITKGRYKGDLVKIVGVDGDMVRIRVFPRIEGERKLFKPENFKSQEVIKSNGYYIYKRDTYLDGFLEKDVLRSTIDFGAEPTLEELEMFLVPCTVSVGDRVRVCRGELLGMKGIIKSINGSIATIEGENGRFEMESSGVCKHFEVGEAVSYKGENGIVVKIDDKQCVVAMHDFTDEVNASIDDLKMAVAKGPKSIGRTGITERKRVKKDPLINKEVQVQVGEYKGHVGLVKDIDRNMCRVQLNSNMKFVNVERCHVIVLDYQASARSSKYSEPATFATPGYKTPGYRTPGYKTPNVSADDVGIEWLNEDDKPYKGTLINVLGKEVLIEDYQNDLFITKDGRFASEDVSFVQPQKNDLICVLDGERKGVTGILIAINGDSAIIRSAGGPVIHIPMSCISRKMY